MKNGNPICIVSAIAMFAFKANASDNDDRSPVHGRARDNWLVVNVGVFKSEDRGIGSPVMALAPANVNDEVRVARSLSCATLLVVTPELT